MPRPQIEQQSEVLRWTYGLVPIAAGVDKFTNVLTDWSKYLSPLARRLLPVSPTTFMRAVGIIEIGAGALVLGRRTSRIGAYVVGGWLGAIALNLITNRSFDIAVRDIAMGIGAITLARMIASRNADRSVAKPAVPQRFTPEGVDEARVAEPMAGAATSDQLRLYTET